MRPIVLRRNRFGVGAYAGRRFTKGEIIEDCAVLVVDGSYGNVRAGRGLIIDYAFIWGRGLGIALGRTNFCNHSAKPNAVALVQTRRQRVLLVAKKTIARGTEITFDYGPTARRTWPEAP